MSKKFPLYDRLIEKVKSKKDVVLDVDKVCSTIANIPRTMDKSESDKHLYNIGALIFHHEIYNNGMLLSTTPFDIKILPGGKGMVVKIQNLPRVLQLIIAEYIREYSSH